MRQKELDPKVVRLTLVEQKARGVSFTEAWRVVRGPGKRTEVGLYMREHFEAAYQGLPAPVVKPDAIALLCEATHSDGKPWAEISDHAFRPAVTSRTAPPTDHDGNGGTCRSGEDCSRRAVRGYFGPLWCEHHGARLEGIRNGFAEAEAEEAALMAGADAA